MVVLMGWFADTVAIEGFAHSFAVVIDVIAVVVFATQVGAGLVVFAVALYTCVVRLGGVYHFGPFRAPRLRSGSLAVPTLIGVPFNPRHQKRD